MDLACGPHPCHVQRLHGHHVLPQVYPHDSKVATISVDSSGTNDDPGLSGVKYVRLKEISVDDHKVFE